MQIVVLIGTVVASPHMGEILRLCDFFDCPGECAQVELLNRFSRFIAQTTCCRERKCLLHARTMGDVIWGKYAPKSLQKWPWIGNLKP